MKKLITLSLVAALCITFASCNKKDTPKGDASSETSISSTEGKSEDKKDKTGAPAEQHLLCFDVATIIAQETKGSGVAHINGAIIGASDASSFVVKDNKFYVFYFDTVPEEAKADTMVIPEVENEEAELKTTLKGNYLLAYETEDADVTAAFEKAIA